MQFLLFIGTMRTLDKLRFADQPDIAAKDSVGIVKVGKDQRKRAEIFRKLRIELAVPCKKSSQCPRFNGTEFIDQPCTPSQFRHLGIAEHFEMGGGKGITKRRNGRKCQYEIAYRPASNHQNFAPLGTGLRHFIGEKQ